MAFTTYADISDQLPIGHNQSAVERQLRLIERMFLNHGLVFGADRNVTNMVFDVHNIGGNCLFHYCYIKSVTSLVEMSHYSDTGTTLVAGQDYRLLPPSDTFSKGFELNYVLHKPYYLSFTGSVGFQTTPSQNIVDAIVEYLIQHQYATLSGGFIVRSKTGNDSEVQYSESKSRDYYFKPEDFPELQTIIAQYAC